MKKYFILIFTAVEVFCCENYKWNPLIRNSHHIAALVLARGGSKGIPLKNLARVQGKTLLGRSLETIIESKRFSSIWVSTDHLLIAEEAAKFGVNIHWRSKKTATDSTSSIITVQEFIKNHLEADYVALIQCTSPFLRSAYLKIALKILRESESDCVFSATKSYKLRWKKTTGGTLVPVNFDPKNRPRRQDWEGEFVENGMFYISKRNLIESGHFQNNRWRLATLTDT